eukprot:CAMPEP_0182442264 /NCGR_PEP_ID=MMETSP1172-20130603/1199_1 /TAXON_ID=708627 /ORGANISM="Timspurckia oligopyrenoides, Strain CCMP3278" /LENGTH=685 /DNA_ID=CAMNT_0024637025 /DNA_START=161 /DNA_END=2221 /DNA_ORIENTATION=-
MSTLLRNSEYYDLADWLPRGGMLRKKKFYQLRGVILVQKDSEDEDAEEIMRLCLFNVSIIGKRNKLSIEMRELKQNLYFEDIYTFEKWLQALQCAASRRISDFYLLNDKIGAGATATVFRATDRHLGEVVAVKVISRSERSAREIRQIEIESTIVMIANHPCIVATYDIFETDDTLYLVMEHMPGGTLESRLLEQHFFAEHEVREILRPLLCAVAFLHANGVVHRDIKPENVLCANQDWPPRPKLADFGLGGIIPAELLTLEDDDLDYYFSEIMGSWYYLSPEQSRREKYGLKVDVWALGVTMYRLISGEYPFDGETVTDVIHAVQEGCVRFAHPRFAVLSNSAMDLLSKMLEPNASHRISAEDALRHEWVEASERDLIMFRNESNRASMDLAMSLLSMKPKEKFKQRRSIQMARDQANKATQPNQAIFSTRPLSRSPEEASGSGTHTPKLLEKPLLRTLNLKDLDSPGMLNDFGTLSAREGKEFRLRRQGFSASKRGEALRGEALSALLGSRSGSRAKTPFSESSPRAFEMRSLFKGVKRSERNRGSAYDSGGVSRTEYNFDLEDSEDEEAQKEGGHSRRGLEFDRSTLQTLDLTRLQSAGNANGRSNELTTRSKAMYLESDSDSEASSDMDPARTHRRSFSAPSSPVHSKHQDSIRKIRPKAPAILRVTLDRNQPKIRRAKLK